MKEITDAVKLRRRTQEVFELAALPGRHLMCHVLYILCWFYMCMYRGSILYVHAPHSRCVLQVCIS